MHSFYYWGGTGEVCLAMETFIVQRVCLRIREGSNTGYLWGRGGLVEKEEG